MLGRDAAGDRRRVAVVPVVLDDAAAVAERRVELGPRRVVRHDDRRGHAEQGRRERDGLRVVARRVRDDAGRPVRGVQPGERVVGAAELEGAHPLQVLGLEPHLGTDHAVEQPRGEHRRPVRDAVEPARGGDDVGVRRRAERQRGHHRAARGHGGDVLPDDLAGDRLAPRPGATGRRAAAAGRGRPSTGPVRVTRGGGVSAQPNPTTAPSPTVSLTAHPVVGSHHDGSPSPPVLRRTPVTTLRTTRSGSRRYSALTAPSTFVSESFASPKSRLVFGS